MGADPEPGGRAPVETQGWRGCQYGARRPRPVEAHRSFDADDGPLAAPGPRLREDLPALFGASRAVRGRLRARLVQADASRHGPACPLPGTRGSQGRARVAGPDPGG